MRKHEKGPHKIGHVVEDFYIGDIHVRICDDYCRDKTPEDVDKILKRIAELTYGPLVEAQLAREEEERRRLAEAEGKSAEVDSESA